MKREKEKPNKTKSSVYTYSDHHNSFGVHNEKEFVVMSCHHRDDHRRQVMCAYTYIIHGNV